MRKFAESHPNHSINDLIKINKALKNYYEKYGKYPKSVGIDGIISCWGKSGSEWIPGLAPSFIPNLPNNLANSRTCENQYLYISNQKDYKLIHHTPYDCEDLEKELPSLIDPIRQCWAYGFWTKDAVRF